jgi:hypothetical protein
MSLRTTTYPDLTSHLATGWNFFRHELLFVAWSMMEVSLITPVLLTFMPWARYWPPWQVAFWFILIMFIPFNLSRLLSVLKIQIERQHVVMVIGLLLVLLFSWRTLLYRPSSLLDMRWLTGFFNHFGESGNPYWSRDVAVFIMIVLAWWRGISLIGRRIDISSIGFRMRAGTLLIAIFVAGLTGTHLPWSTVPFVMTFYFASLVAIVLTRVEQLELGRSGQSFPLGPRWLLVVLAAAGSVVFAAGVTAGFIGGDSVLEVVGWFAPLWLAVNFLASSVASTVGFLSVPLLLVFEWFLKWLMGLFGPWLESGLEEIQVNIETAFSNIEFEETAETTRTAIQFPRELLTILVMVLVLLVVSLALRRIFRLIRPTATLDRESVGLMEGLGRLERPGLGSRLLDRLGLLKRWRVAASIRQIYRNMCLLAADRGYPRIHHETPLEYLGTLARAWPDHSTETKLITEAFNQVRYGEIPEDPAKLEKLKLAWSRLKSDSALETASD